MALGPIQPQKVFKIDPSANLISATKRFGLMVINNLLSSACTIDCMLLCLNIGDTISARKSRSMG